MAFHFTRRRFLQVSAAALSSSLFDQASALASTPTESTREVLHELPYGTVTLTGGPLKQQYDRTHAGYLALDNDRLLKVYRQRAGMPAPGPDMGGWYDTDGFVPATRWGNTFPGSRASGRPRAIQPAPRKRGNSFAVSAPPWGRITNPSSGRRRICGFVTPSINISPA